MLVSVDPGLIIWTIVTFLILVFLLGKLGWKPIVKGEHCSVPVSDILQAEESP